MVSGQYNQDEWEPDPDALEVTRWAGDPARSSPVIVLSHPMDPYLKPLDAEADRSYFDIATSYIMDANNQAKLELPEVWLQELRNGGSERFNWIAIEGPELPPHEHASVRFDRLLGDDLIERSVVLIASELSEGVPLGSEFGLAVHGHVDQLETGDRRLRITGVAAALPFGPWADYLTTRQWPEPLRFSAEFDDRLRQRFASLLDLDAESLLFRGFRVAMEDGGQLIETRGVGLDRGEEDAPRLASEYVGRWIKKAVNDPIEPVALTKVSLVVSAGAGKANLFEPDPASQPVPMPRGPDDQDSPRRRRPRREKLDRFRPNQQPILPTPSGPLQSEYVEVHKSRFVLADGVTSGIKQIALPNTGTEIRPSIRSHEFSAIAPYYHLNEFFGWLLRFRIDP
jgi:hypothetical protein